MKPKIAYSQIQKDYPDEIVAMDPEQTQIVAHAKSFSALISQLQNSGENPQDFVYLGPVQKPGTVSV